MKVPVKSFNARTNKNHEAIFNVRIEIINTQQLEEIIRKIRQIPDVNEIIRVFS